MRSIYVVTRLAVALAAAAAILGAAQSAAVAPFGPHVGVGIGAPVSAGRPVVMEPIIPTTYDGDLRELPREGHGQRTSRPELEPPPAGPARSADPDRALQTATPVIRAPAPSVTFAGLSHDAYGSGWPPDTNGDVGPNHYVQAVNTSIGVFSKTGTLLTALTYNDFFPNGDSIAGTPCADHNQGDPIVVYDHLGGHWIVSDFAWSDLSKGPFYECFAVSRTENPLNGGWWFYAVQTDDGPNLSDYPKLGVWPDGIYMSANRYAVTSEGGHLSFAFSNVRAWALSRSDMESGAIVRAVRFDAPSQAGGVTVFGLLPSNLRGPAPPAGRPNLFASIWGSYAVRIWKFHADWATLGNSTFTGPSDVTIDAFRRAPRTAPERAPGNDLDTLTYRLMMQNQYRNIGGTESLWLTHTVGVGAACPNVPCVAAVRWYQVNVTGGTVVTSGPVQQGTWNPQIPGLAKAPPVARAALHAIHRFMPSLAVDGSGDMAIGYSVSSSSLYPGIRYAGRLASDPLNTLGQGEQTLFRGTGAQTNTCGGAACERWGDYSAMTVDPTDDCTFWYTNEYYATNGGNWQTRIGKFKFSSCTGSPQPTPTPTHRPTPP